MKDSDRPTSTPGPRRDQLVLHIYFAGIFMRDLYNIFSFEKIEKLFILYSVNFAKFSISQN